MDKYSILIIDDDDNLRDGLMTLLEAHGFQTKGAANGKLAILFHGPAQPSGRPPPKRRLCAAPHHSGPVGARRWSEKSR